ncbi:MAG: acyltransferase [Pseudomonadota bacterium]
MKIFHTIGWWLRGLAVLRHPSLVRELGDIRATAERLARARAEYAAQGFRLSRTAMLENWAPQRLCVGENVAVEHGTILSWPVDGDAQISIGAHTWIGPYNNLRTASGGRLTFGERCLVSQFCSFVTHNHGIRRGVPIQLQALSEERTNITVGDDVWFGVGCTVLPGVSVGNGAVIGAGSVVTRDVPAHEVWAGSPACRIGERT